MKKHFYGWLEVPSSLLENMKLLQGLKKYSYQKNDMTYIEENCDGALYLKYVLDNKYKIIYNNIPHRGQKKNISGDKKITLSLQDII